MAEGHCPSGAQLAPTSTLETLLTQEGLEPGEAPAQARDYPGAAAGARSAAALQGAGCHDCGQRDARARSGPARGPVADRRSLQSPQPGARSPERAADSGQALRARPRGEQCAPRTSRRGPGTALGADSGSGLPPGWSSRMGDPAVASRTLRAPRSEGCPEGWESGPGTREPACGGRGQRTVPGDVRGARKICLMGMEPATSCCLAFSASP
ncbi:PREDICTED: uncharacterized protein LOC108514487 [Rhinopithecus bieti]|uniref:uncharacterized protein LOC108514487 n=1 Tax=Rhinopithecus bieti TaxID=61621 RepID=UPI00083C58E5|nr:PREDICTED: uncharacterized protein LOC108514487 [Rhinopithecus bieti]